MQVTMSFKTKQRMGKDAATTGVSGILSGIGGVSDIKVTRAEPIVTGSGVGLMGHKHGGHRRSGSSSSMADFKAPGFAASAIVERMYKVNVTFEFSGEAPVLLTALTGAFSESNFDIDADDAASAAMGPKI